MCVFVCLCVVFLPLLFFNYSNKEGGFDLNFPWQVCV